MRMEGPGWLLGTGFAAGGMLGGAVLRIVLGRLRRGAGAPVLCCELGVGALWAVTGLRVAGGGLPGWWCPVPLVLACLAVPLVVTDLRHRRLPDALTLAAYPVLGVTLIAVAAGGGGAGILGRAVLGAVLFGGAHLCVHLISPRSLGAGDVKLSGSIGAVLGAVGWHAVVLAMAVASVATAVLAATLAVVSGRGRWAGQARRAGQHDTGPVTVPHGPGLLGAAWLVAAFPGAGAAVGPG